MVLAELNMQDKYKVFQFSSDHVLLQIIHSFIQTYVQIIFANNYDSNDLTLVSGRAWLPYDQIRIQHPNFLDVGS